MQQPLPNQTSHSTPATAADVGIDTPGKFLDPAKVFHPSFDLQVSQSVSNSITICTRSVNK